MRNVRGYVRTSRQTDDLEVYRQGIELRCRHDQMNLVKVYIDDESSPEDLAWKGMTDLASEVSSDDIIIVVNTSKLLLNPHDISNVVGYFSNNQVILLSLQADDSTHSSDSSSSEKKMEVKNLNNRTRPPFGWKCVAKGKDFEPVPEQQEVLKKIMNLHVGGMNLSQIAKTLNAQGDNLTLSLNKKKGSTFSETAPIFHAMTIKRILAGCGMISVPSESGACISSKLYADRI